MNGLMIDEPHGLQTVLSDDPDSPAAPYVHEYQPRTLKDLQELDIIPKSVNLDHLQNARDEVLAKHASGHVHLVPPLVERANGYPYLGQYVRAYNAAYAQRAEVDAMSTILIRRYGYDPREADLLARKTVSLGTALEGSLGPIWRRIELADDLLIYSPAIVASTINSILARDIVIFRDGHLIVKGAYLLITCHSLSGETLYWDKVKQRLGAKAGR